MSTQFHSQQLNSFEAASSLEWLETNGLGGYASSTVSGANSRRYHGLLVAAMNPPVGRTVVLSKLDETLVLGDQRIELGANQYPGTVHPQGFQFLKSFERKMFPEFIYESSGITLKKTIGAIHGENTVVILYEVIAAPSKFKLELLPLCSARDYHALCHANDSLYTGYLFDEGLFQTKNYQDCPELFISAPGSNFIPTQQWYYHLEYPMEQTRGLDFREDLFNHGKFEVELEPGETLGIFISTHDPKGTNATQLLRKEEKRREALTRKYTNQKTLVLAADQFIVKRGSDLKTVIAGYHWFSDWGRDTMIALPGLCLKTDRFEDARKILLAFAESESEGMLPNRFPDQGEAPEYNTVDATLWFFIAIYKYYKITSDIEFVRTLMPVLNDIIDWHYKGTRYNIRVDTDELLYAGQNGVQLTWMDAKVGDWVVTPRIGKAVEINALWYNALHVMSELLSHLNLLQEAREFKVRADKVGSSFEKLFWNKAKGCLYDYVNDDPDSSRTKNDDIRPNQIYAVSLPFRVLSKDKAEKVFKVVTEKLLTPRGLRSLSQDHPDYKPIYQGNPWHRDGAYHQGTVWSFLLGAYIDALMNLKGAKGKPEAAKIINTILEHLNEAGVGTVSEIFDGEPPHHPRGCIAQAWSVGEVLRVVMEYELIK